MKPILEINNISKKFRINHEQQPYLSLRDRLANVFKSKTTTEDFWALKDVSFNVMPGDTIGIIGKNGAGKSTLLKILSKITPPTSGKIISRGRIASLLEVGTGFHSELSGRENIFLNGSILGMKRVEIQKQFDAIVDFSGVEKFIDTPIKHYSSGMQLRLAFAVAAFLEPEILIIDEVLAVGDAEFQKKCMGKMGEVSKSGRTVLFVSHQLGAITTLCRNSILLNKGTVEIFADTNKTIEHYLLHQQNMHDSNEFVAKENTTTNDAFRFLNVNTTNNQAVKASSFGFNENINLNISLFAGRNITDELISVALLDKYGNRIFTILKNIEAHHVKNNMYSCSVKLPSDMIAPNVYSFHFAICNPDGNVFDKHEEQCRLTIFDTGTQMSLFEGKDYGSIIVNCEWK
jgi:lipopolysaccharide transport system ATP-binding protein